MSKCTYCDKELNILYNAPFCECPKKKRDMQKPGYVSEESEAITELKKKIAKNKIITTRQIQPSQIAGAIAPPIYGSGTVIRADDMDSDISYTGLNKLMQDMARDCAEAQQKGIEAIMGIPDFEKEKGLDRAPSVTPMGFLDVDGNITYTIPLIGSPVTIPADDEKVVQTKNCMIGGELVTEQEYYRRKLIPEPIMDDADLGEDITEEEAYIVRQNDARYTKKYDERYLETVKEKYHHTGYRQGSADILEKLEGWFRTHKTTHAHLFGFIMKMRGLIDEEN